MIVLPDSTNGTCTCSNTGWVPGYWSYNSTVRLCVSCICNMAVPHVVPQLVQLCLELCVCVVFKAPRTYTPVLGALVSPLCKTKSSLAVWYPRLLLDVCVC